MSGKKFFVYTRVSSDDYEKSIDNQKDIIIKLAENDWISTKNLIYVSEEKSGKKWSNRTEFQKIIDILEEDYKKNKKNIENREYGWIYFFKIDRLSRNDWDFQKVFNLLDAWYLFKSATETIENTPTWRLLFRMLSSFAIFESEKLSSRESIAQLHNIILENFKSLWWRIAIFWYNMAKTTSIKNGKSVTESNIEINETESEIIREIYELFLDGKAIPKNKKTYSQIFDFLDEKHEWYLTNYMRRESTSYTNKDSIISKVLKNDNMMRYNWFIKRNINVNDELIVNYISAISEKKLNYFEINWINKIGWKIEFIFYYPEFTIIDDILYNSVKKYLLNKTEKMDNQIEKKYNWLFANIIYFKSNDWEFHKISKSYMNKNKWTYHYRVQHRWISYEISEKQQIEEKIKKCGIVERILSLDNKFIDMIKNKLKDIEKSENKDVLAWLIWQKNIFEWMIKRYEFLLETEKENGKFISQKKLLSEYKEKVQKIDRDIEITRNWWIINIEHYIELFQLKNFFLQTEYIRRLFYIAFFEEIIFDENKEVAIVLYDFLVDLWLPKEINI